jgi:DNA-binding response OmpR family regulator
MSSNATPLIFVIDKNPIHNSLIKYHLNVNRYFNVQSFSSGNECFYRLQKNVLPDFIIMDYVAGDLNGFDFLRKARALSPQSNIIFFSSYDDPILAVRLLDGGATDYIAKTGKLELGISELLKNLAFLCREKQQVEKP